MSSISEDQELLEAFVIESRELLDQAERDLLALDKQGTRDTDLVNGIFRAMHSVKGAAGFFGLKQIGTLSHRLESVLARLRDGDLAPSPELNDRLLQSNDFLRTLLDDLDASRSVDISVELGQLDRFLEARGPGLAKEATADRNNNTLPTEPAPLASSAEVTTPVPPATVKQPSPQSGPLISDDQSQHILANGQRLYRLIVCPAEDLAAKSQTFDAYVEQLKTMGQILTPPDQLTPRAEADASASFELLIASVLAPDLAAIGFDLPAERVQELPIGELRSRSPGNTTTSITPQPPVSKDAPPERSAIPPVTTASDLGLDADVAAESASEMNDAETKAESSSSSIGSALRVEETVRVKTSVLDALMQMAGEMVLARNRVVRRIENEFDGNQGLRALVNEFSGIATSLQDEIMRMRLQPVKTLFRKFHRVVRDLSRQLGKDVTLSCSGEDVELDRTIIETLSDPLTHLVRNSLDHGIELPAQRVAAGKRRAALVQLRAFHQDGMVQIEVQDDGRGIDIERVRAKAISLGLVSEDAGQRLSPTEVVQLIFAPGFSTATTISDVSGRGVGMDVVRTNIESIGGTVEAISSPGQGCVVRLKLPLTLAIVSAMIVESGGRRFALPQVGLEEVVRLIPGAGSGRVELIRDSEVLRHRGMLLPLVRLSTILGLQAQVVRPDHDEPILDRRMRIGDRRQTETADSGESERRQTSTDRRSWWGTLPRILVLRVGANRFGLIVDRILDKEEIVVKPLSRYVRSSLCFSGATILGDGSIALILDPMGIVKQTQLRFTDVASANKANIQEQRRTTRPPQPVLLFSCGTDETFALPLVQVSRIESIPAKDLRYVGDRTFVNHGNRWMPLYWPHRHLPVRSGSEHDQEQFHAVIPRLSHSAVGIVTHRVIDTCDADLEIDRETLTSPGLVGTAVLDGRMVVVVDTHTFLAQADPEQFGAPYLANESFRRAVLVEPIPLYRAVLDDYLKAMGFEVILALDEKQGLVLLRERGADVVITPDKRQGPEEDDLPMRMRDTPDLAHIPIVLTSNARRAGDSSPRAIDGYRHDYTAKLDRYDLAHSLVSARSRRQRSAA